MKIGILSDTHSYLDQRILHHLSGCDEIWHIGDFGNYEVVEKLEAIAPVRGVYGNIDGNDIRSTFGEEAVFDCEGVSVYMRHICGYPGRYNPKARMRINELRPGLVLAGHSHICKVVRDPYFNHLHINPGAAGIHGFHKMRTMTLAQISAGKVAELKVVELGLRAALD
ncbi:YfcE family phosphodiesterase [bacterium]|nr:YfcE family phosphodiesterase [bacterium]